MYDALLQLTLFSAKSFILLIVILMLFIGIIAIATRGKQKLAKGKITIENLNENYLETKQELLQEILPKKKFKKFLKEQKILEKEKDKMTKNIFVINFHGDLKASAVANLREEVTAILNIASKEDEVVVRLNSAGGMVNTYGLAAAQLARIRQKNIPLTVIVDKIAASGGYLMACIANKILAAPFAIIGSIGVIVQLPNFHRLLKEKNIDFEQLTAGNYKRTLTMFGHNTEEGREKLKEEIEEIHHLFKDVIKEHRQQLDVDKVATGEHWLAAQALTLNLVDELMTSDDYLLKKSQDHHLYEIAFHAKKSLGERLSASAQALKSDLLGVSS